MVEHALPIFWWLSLLKVYQKWFTFKSIKLKDIIFQSQCRCNWNKRRKSLLLNPVRQFGKQSPVRLYHKWMNSKQFIYIYMPLCVYDVVSLKILPFKNSLVWITMGCSDIRWLDLIFMFHSRNLILLNILCWFRYKNKKFDICCDHCKKSNNNLS